MVQKFQLAGGCILATTGTGLRDGPCQPLCSSSTLTRGSVMTALL